MNDLRSPPTVREQFFQAPVFYLTHATFLFFTTRIPLFPPKKHIRIVCISDTHNHISDVPDGDVLIHAGDLSHSGTVPELQIQIGWLDSLPHKTKIVIAGNHDSWLDSDVRARLDETRAAGFVDWKSLIYLEDSSRQINIPFPDEMVTRSTTVYGSPWVPKCGGSDFAFQYNRFESRSRWRNKIPAQTEVLITHTPPRYYQDAAYGRTHIGCDGLLEELWRMKPSLHVFGHVHSGRGKIVLKWDATQAVYERACARNRENRTGGMVELLNIFAWVDFFLVLILGGWSLAKSWIGWDRAEKRTVLINAAMWYDEAGNQIAPIQVVDI